MKQTIPGRRWRWLRAAGVALAGGPVLLMLGTGLAASLASGRPLLDPLLPAELFPFTLAGMGLLAAADRAENRPRRRLSLALALAALGALVLCQGAALLTGIASGSRPARGPAWWLVLGLLALYDLCALAAPLVGLGGFRRKR